MLAATVSNDDNGATAVGATAASVAADGGSGSKPAAVLLTVGGGTNDGASLQDSFLKFKQQRARTLKMQREKRARDLKDPKRKEKLRAKFLERVRSYMGVVRVALFGSAVALGARAQRAVLLSSSCELSLSPVCPARPPFVFITAICTKVP